MKIAWSVLSCVAVAASAAAAEQKRPVPSYTNEDLARVSERRAETGVESDAALPPPTAVPGRRTEQRAHGEEYWRHEVERQRRRLEPLERRLAGLEAKLAERRRQPGVRPYSDPQVESYETQLKTLRERIREEQSRFEDRARREGAMPGWLR